MPGAFLDATLSTILLTGGAALVAIGNEHKEQDTTAGLSVQTVQAALKACQFSAKDNFGIAIGICDKMSYVTERLTREQDARLGQRDKTDDYGSQFALSLSNRFQFCLRNYI